MGNLDNCDKNECRPSGCKIIGGVLLAIATILTIITLNGIAIFGMFLVSIVFLGHHKSGWSRGCCESNSCYNETKTSCNPQDNGVVHHNE